MAYYIKRGKLPKHRHTEFRDENGNLYYEELLGEEGFSLDSGLAYHKHIPSAIVDTKVWDLGNQDLTPNHPLNPLHLRLRELEFPEGTDAVRGRRLVLGNADVRINYAHVTETSPLYKNAIGDECVYVERGSALVETMFGALEIKQGDYLIMPNSIIHRYVMREGEDARLYFIETNSHVTPPRRYRSRHGQLLEHSPFFERDFRVPEDVLLAEGENVDVYIKHRGNSPSGAVGTIHTVPNHPFDIVGWDGCFYPYVFSVYDYAPLTGKLHQPPPTHQVWEAHNLVVCNFVPRKTDYAEGAIPVPYYHSNVDSDEVMFYVEGNYEARKGSGIKEGSISLHPFGHSHGPQPGAMEASIGVEYFDELAVMVDTFQPLLLGEAAFAADDPAYVNSWNNNQQ